MSQSSRPGRRTFLGWIDARFPLTRWMREHATEYYAGINFNFWYAFGALALVVLIIQFVTGILLTASYQPSAEGAFASIEYIMREVEWGWLIRYAHSTGASAFFIVMYLHIFRGLMYGSYKKPRELVWTVGTIIYLVLVAEAFTGYVLPWGNMSYWGAQVIVSLFGDLPLVGDAVANWVRGDFYISGITLNRFFAYHVAFLPLILVVLVVVHIVALHEVGSNNPDGVDIKAQTDASGKPLDGVAFHPYYTSKDLTIIIVFLILFCGVVFFAPEMGGYFLEHANFEPADPLGTPEHIAPVWYFTPFYAVLWAVPDKFLGAWLMALAMLAPVFLPWLDRCPVRSIRYRGWTFKVALALFCISFVTLGYLGLQPVTGPYTVLARISSAIYFGFFFLMPLYTHFENPKRVPDRVIR